MITESLKEEMRGQTTEEVLDSLSLEVMRDNIYQQIYDELPSNRDFMSIVLGKFNFISQNRDEFDDETLAKVHTEIVEFCEKIINFIVGKFDLAYNEAGGKEKEVAELLYQFFVIKRADNTQTFIMQYIEDNKADIVEQLGLEKSSDVVYTSSSKKIADPDNIKIVSNVDAIIKYIISLNLPADEFLEVLCAEGDYYAQQLMDYVEEGTILGNFASEYMHGILEDYDSDYASKIRNDIRIHFGSIN